MEKLTQANEDYLEAIVVLAGDACEPVRSVDLAAHLGVSKPSVNKALALLKQQGCITQEPYRGIVLTPEGAAYGAAVLQRHRMLTRFFAEVLGVEAQVAEEEACRIEHVISQDTFDRWTAYIDEVLP